jgi:pimeloyl-ACP methyl ester carboxylesterase
LQTISVQGRKLEYVRLPSAHPKADAPAMVFLHEGLGSVAMWRDFPQRVADATGCEAIVYSRYGYGRSDRLEAPRNTRYMHDEAILALPEFLDKLAVDRSILCGHSDGGSIALIHAGGTRRPVSGIIVIAPHVMVEEITVQSIAEAKIAWQTTELRQRLGRYHDHVEETFLGWNDIWLHPDFRTWNIEEYLPHISAPILAIQGEDDEYASMEQIDRIGRQSKDVDLVKLADCRHSPHKDQPEAVIAAVAEFVARILD